MTTSSGRGAHAIRHLTVLRLLCQSRGPVTVAQLMPYTGTHERTVYRDLSDLSAAGIPIERDKVRGTFQLKKRDFMRWLEKRDQKSTDEA